MENNIKTLKTISFKSEIYEETATLYRITTYDNGYEVTYLLKTKCAIGEKKSEHEYTYKEYEDALSGWRMRIDGMF